MKISTTHRPGECDACDAYRLALANVTRQTCARSSSTACIGLAQEAPNDPRR